jgi:hypothetical protein
MKGLLKSYRHPIPSFTDFEILPRRREMPVGSLPDTHGKRQVYARQRATQHFFRLELSILLT